MRGAEIDKMATSRPTEVTTSRTTATTVIMNMPMNMNTQPRSK